MSVAFRPKTLNPLFLYRPNTGLINLSSHASKIGKIRSACEQLEIQYKKLRMNTYTYNYIYNSTLILYYTSHAVKIY